MKIVIWSLFCLLALICGFTLVNDQQMNSADLLASRNVTSDDEATFSCRRNSSDDIDWLVNGTSIIQNPNPDISVNEDKSTLTIVAQRNYSGTTVQCVEVYVDRSPILSNRALLLVQGALDSVADLTVTPSESAISLTWTPPFSLDLSYFDTDTLYRVEVCRLNGSEAFNCSSEVVSKPQYSFPARPGDLFQVTITPLSPRQNGPDLEGRSKVHVNLTVTFPDIPETTESSTQTTTTGIEANTTDMKTDDDITLGLVLGPLLGIPVLVILLVCLIVVTCICYKKRAGSEASCMGLTVKKDHSTSAEHAESVVETSFNEDGGSNGGPADIDPAASPNEVTADKVMFFNDCKEVMNNHAASDMPNAKMKPPPKMPPTRNTGRKFGRMSQEPKENMEQKCEPPPFAEYVEPSPPLNEVNIQAEDLELPPPEAVLHV